MIAYKYKLYRTKKISDLDRMFREAAFVWNHALSLQKRYYRRYKKYIPISRLKKHFANRIHRHLLHSQTVQEILERLDKSYWRYFKKLAKRSPKFKKAINFSSIVYKQGGFQLYDNVLKINKINKEYKFSKSREYEGNIKTVSIKRSKLSEYYVVIVTDKVVDANGKSRDGASVGIDFGLKTYLTLSDGTTASNPQFLKREISELKKASRRLSKAKLKSKNRQKRKMELNRVHERITNKRSDFQWKLAHELCRNYGTVHIEDLKLTGMTRLWGRKMNDIAHGSFVEKLTHVASQYKTLIHKIDRFYPSSKTCECGYVYKELALNKRKWICKECRLENQRDLLAANNILRSGIYELESANKTGIQIPRRHACIQESRYFSGGSMSMKSI